MSKKILIIDIETTGFLQQGGRIVEIGIVELDLSNGDKKTLFDEVCHEKGMTLRDIENSWIVQNSTLTVEEVRHSRSIEAMKNEVQNIINSYPLGATAFNNKFDFDFLESRGFEFVKKLDCPMKLSTNIIRLPSPRGGYKWPKVQEAYDYFFGKTDYVETHRGADDAYHEADIVYKLYKTNIFKIN